MLSRMIARVHSIRAGAARAGSVRRGARSARAASSRTVAAAAPTGTSNFTVFLRGAPIGTEQVAVTRGADGWTIASSGRIGAPLELVTRNLQMRYTPDWKPLELTLDATVRGQASALRITVAGTTATTHVNNAGQAADRTDTIDRRRRCSCPTVLRGLRSGRRAADDGRRRDRRSRSTRRAGAASRSGSATSEPSRFRPSRG